MPAEAVTQFLQAVEKRLSLRKELLAAKAEQPHNMATRVVEIAAQHGFAFTDEEYKKAVTEEYDQLFQFHRAVFHFHLLEQPPVA